MGKFFAKLHPPLNRSQQNTQAIACQVCHRHALCRPLLSAILLHKLTNIHQHCWKISKLSKFQGHTSNAGEGIAQIQSCKSLQRFVSKEAGLCPTTIETFVKFRDFQSYIFVSFQQITFKLGNFTIFKASFPAMSMGFFDQSQSNVEKIVEGSWSLTLFCHLRLTSVTSSPIPPPPHHAWLNSCSFFLPLWIKQNCIHPGRLP